MLENYEDQLSHSNLLNSPASNFVTLNDLNITLPVDRTTNYYKDSVSGNVSITYCNGTAFKGYFRIWVYRIGVDSKSFTSQPIDGFAVFNLSPPVFQYGPRYYIISIDP